MQDDFAFLDLILLHNASYRAPWARQGEGNYLCARLLAAHSRKTPFHRGDWQRWFWISHSEKRVFFMISSSPARVRTKKGSWRCLSFNLVLTERGKTGSRARLAFFRNRSAGA